MTKIILKNLNWIARSFYVMNIKNFYGLIIDIIQWVLFLVSYYLFQETLSFGFKSIDVAREYAMVNKDLGRYALFPLFESMKLTANLTIFSALVLFFVIVLIFSIAKYLHWSLIFNKRKSVNGCLMFCLANLLWFVINIAIIVILGILFKEMFLALLILFIYFPLLVFTTTDFHHKLILKQDFWKAFKPGCLKRTHLMIIPYLFAFMILTHVLSVIAFSGIFLYGNIFILAIIIIVSLYLVWLKSYLYVISQ